MYLPLLVRSMCVLSHTGLKVGYSTLCDSLVEPCLDLLFDCIRQTRRARLLYVDSFLDRLIAYHPSPPALFPLGGPGELGGGGVGFKTNETSTTSLFAWHSRA